KRLVPTARLELAQLSPLPPQDSVSTNFTTSAWVFLVRPADASAGSWTTHRVYPEKRVVSECAQAFPGEFGSHPMQKPPGRGRSPVPPAHLPGIWAAPVAGAASAGAGAAAGAAAGDGITAPSSTLPEGAAGRKLPK